MIVRVNSDELSEGARVQVIVLVDMPEVGQHSLSSFPGAAKGGSTPPVEVDAFLRAERDSWER